MPRAPASAASCRDCRSSEASLIWKPRRSGGAAGDHRLPELDAEAMRAVIEACEKSGLPFRMVPRLDDVFPGRSRPGELKGKSRSRTCLAASR